MYASLYMPRIVCKMDLALYTWSCRDGSRFVCILRVEARSHRARTHEPQIQGEAVQSTCRRWEYPVLYFITASPHAQVLRVIMRYKSNGFPKCCVSGRCRCHLRPRIRPAREFRGSGSGLRGSVCGSLWVPWPHRVLCSSSR